MAAGTEQLTHSFGWGGTERFQQQDVTEFFNLLCDSLENNFRGTSGAGVIKALFAGRENRFCRCEACGYKSGREQEIRALMLALKQ